MGLENVPNLPPAGNDWGKTFAKFGWMLLYTVVGGLAGVASGQWAQIPYVGPVLAVLLPPALAALHNYLKHKNA